MSNSGEGGEQYHRYNSIKASKIKQFASGRFGVWAGYVADPSLQEIEINLNAAQDGMLDESFLRTFGWAIQKIMGHMFGSPSIPVTVKGTQSQVRDFASALGKEKSYLTNYKKFGLDNPRTYKVTVKAWRRIAHVDARQVKQA